jgi:large subunit ribosomal protein L29
MKTAEIRTKSADELNQQLLELRKEQFNFRFQKSTGQLEAKANARVTAVRKTIAKIKTILAEMKSGKTVAAKPAKKAAKAKADAPAKSKKETKE